MLPYSSLTNATAGIPEPIRDLANTARRAYCNTVKPGRQLAQFVSNDTGLPSLFAPLYDAICNLPGDPPAPNGSAPTNKINPNCSGTRYSLKFRYQVGVNAPNEDVRSDYWGPITPAKEGNDLVFYHYGNGTGAPLATQQRTVIATSGVIGEFKLLEQAPVAGSTVVPCKRPKLPEPPPDYSPQPPIPDIDLPPSWNLPNTKLPVIPRGIEIRPNIEFTPKISLDVGGLNFNFSFDGWDFSISPTINAPIVVLPVPLPVNLPVLPPVPPRNPLPVNIPDCCSDSNGNNVDLTPVINAINGVNQNVLNNTFKINEVDEAVDEALEILDDIPPKLDRIEECVCPGEEELITTIGPVNSFDQDFGRELTHVEWTMVQEGIKNKIQPGMDAPDVTYAGWYSFGKGTGLVPRSPLHYKQSYLVPATEGLTRFAFTAYVGLTATIKIYGRK